MRLITKAEFGRLAGITRSGVAKAVQNRRINLVGRGTKSKIDMDDADNVALLQEYVDKWARREAESAAAQATPQPKKNGKTKAGKSKQKKGAPPVPYDPLPTLTPTKHTEQEHYSVDELTGEQKAGLNSTSVNKLKTLAQIHQIEIKTDKERKKLIDRDLVERIFHRLYAVDVNEWRTLGPNLAPDLGAEFKIDDPQSLIRIEEIIEKKVFLTLQHVKYMMNNFLKELDAQAIEEIIGEGETSL